MHLVSISPESLSQGLEIFEYLLNKNCDINAKAEIFLEFFQELRDHILSFPYVERYLKLVEHFRKFIKNFLPAKFKDEFKAEFTAYDIASWLRNNKLLATIEQRGGQSTGNRLIGSSFAKSIGHSLRRYFVGYKNLIWPSLNKEEE